jgi:hypothetical protein
MKLSTPYIPGAAFFGSGAKPPPNVFALDIELERIKAYAMQDGIEIVTVYSDQGIWDLKKAGN